MLGIAPCNNQGEISYQQDDLQSHDYYVSVSRGVNKLIEFAKRYPIPAFAISGLFVGTLFHWPLNQSSLGQWIWLITLIGGGAPIVWDTFRGMLQKHFASDIVAMMAIVAGDAFEMHADKISEESQYAKIVKLVQKAQQEKAQIQRLGGSAKGYLIL